MLEFPALVIEEVARQPYPLLFMTVSGAHLYGFASPDSDWDLRGVHLLPPRELLGLSDGPATLQTSGFRGELELDLVTHEARKFFQLLLRRNGYVLEQLYSPLLVHATPEFEELRQLARACITRHHVHHYRGFFQTQWKLFEKERPRRVKPLLYAYRILLTGIHLMRTGEIEANLPRLNEQFRVGCVPELLERKRSGPEHSTLPDVDLELHRAETSRLLSEMSSSSERSHLPETPSAQPVLHALLLRLRGFADGG